MELGEEEADIVFVLVINGNNFEEDGSGTSRH